MIERHLIDRADGNGPQLVEVEIDDAEYAARVAAVRARKAARRQAETQADADIVVAPP